MNDLVISTVRRLVKWDGQQKNMVERSNIFGMTWDEGHIYLSWNPLHRDFSVIDKFNKNFEFEEKILDQEQWNIHEIYSWGALYITATGQQSIARLNVETKDLIVKKIDKPQHCNSIFAYGNLLHFHNSNGQPKDSPIGCEILKYDRELNCIYRTTIQKPGHILHSLFIEDDIVYACCHQNYLPVRSNLYIYDLKKKKGRMIEVRKDTENGFLRGMARNKDYFFIGESQQEAIRSRRLMGNSRVLVVDNNFKLVDTIELEDTGQIRCVRLMKEDIAHNGIDF
jgi:hypothetical protein